MIDDLFFAFLTVLVLFGAAMIRPERARAPAGWYVEGVRPTGETTMRPYPPPNCGEPTGQFTQPCPHDGRAIGARIYCTGGTQPIVVDDRTVGCMRGGWR